MGSKYRLGLPLVFVFALISGAPPSGVSAQEYDETLYLDVGERVTLQVSIPGGGVQSWYDILVRQSGGGDMGGLDLFARARRLSGPACESNLAGHSPPAPPPPPRPPSRKLTRPPRGEEVFFISRAPPPRLSRSTGDAGSWDAVR